MTREEFIGRAADAMMRSQGLESPDLVEDEAIAGYVEMAEAALDAVGAWELLEALKTTAGNIRSLGPAGAIREPYTPWLGVVEAAIAKSEGR